jgi:site-specific DNA-cytosine methylase
MKHAHLIPLVGGAAIGTSLALKSNPEYIASWDAFAKNDSFCRQYFKNTPFYSFDTRESWKLPKVDIITCVPPCSGLSTATPSTNRGCSAPQNMHMLKVAERAMMMKTHVVLIENAPTLYSKGGEEFANRFLPLTRKYGYSMVLFLTTTILHGLPQNRKRSFVILYKGKQIPEFEFIKKSYKPLYDWKVEKKSAMAKDWNPKEDEIIDVLKSKLGLKNNQVMLESISGHEYNDNPVTAWKVFTDHKMKYQFATEPYKYMQKTSKSGAGIMDRSPYLVWDHCNALMWKSAHKMLNPAEPSRQFNIRELMNLMGMPKDFKEIPAKDINVLFQNVPVTTVRTVVEEIARQLDRGAGWKKPTEEITRINNIKQTIDIF